MGWRHSRSSSGSRRRSSLCKIAERIIARGLRENVGATPANTVASTIALSIQAPNSPYVRVRRGEYALTRELTEAVEAHPVEELEREETETGALNSFGMFWRRDLVLWTRAKLLGTQSSAAESVNFSEQKGVYLLHDRDRVVYVGRADDTLFARVRAHTVDRLSGRWDRFSWFGLRAVQDNGQLAPIASDWTHHVVIETLEALLIESLGASIEQKARR